jgi:hypothetical protein
VKKGYNGHVEKASHYGSFSVNLGALDRVCILFLKQFDNYASVLEIIDSQASCRSVPRAVLRWLGLWRVCT